MGILELYNEGRFTTAYRVGVETLGPLQDWPDPVLAGRVAHQVGAVRSGRYLHLRAGRRNTEDPSTQVFYAHALLDSLGPWRVYSLIQEREYLFSSAPELERSDWLALKSSVMTRFRDFERAHAILDEAKALKVDNEYLASVESALLERADRHQEALQVLEESLVRQPWYRPCVQGKGELLETLGRGDEAITFLQEAQEKVESCWIAAQLGRLLVERERYQEALECYTRFSELAMLFDKDVDQWLNARLFTCYYGLGEVERAVEQIGANPSEAHKVLLQNLRESSPEAPAKRLPVGLVRQHHMTCAPATLSAIGQYWQRDTDHLQLAEEICYDGTATFLQRRWAEENGWLTREFTVDWGLQSP